MNKQQLQAFTYPYAILFVNKQIEFMKSLDLPLKNKSVLEVGSGPLGMYTNFLIESGADVTSNDIRKEHLDVLVSKIKDHKTLLGDMNTECIIDKYDCIYSLGNLYHLSKPTEAIKHMYEHCNDYLFISSAINKKSYDIEFVNEDTTELAQAYNGIGCRPSINWIIDELKKNFKYVYKPINNPDLDEFINGDRCILLGSNNNIEGILNKWIQC